MNASRRAEPQSTRIYSTEDCEPSSPPFLGSCGVCQRAIPNYRRLANHLRHNEDPPHQDLRHRWHVWKNTYRATLRCRKCGGLFEVVDKTLKDKKRCPPCEGLRQALGKRGYEAIRPIPKPDPRQIMKESKSKARWDGLTCRSVRWSPGDELYQRVVGAHVIWERVRETMKRLGISFSVYQAICQHALGNHYPQTIAERKRQIGRQNLARFHELYRSMTPDEKAAFFQERAQSSRGLEERMCRDLDLLGRPYIRNKWISLWLGDRMVPREADIVLAVHQDHKMVILCDGEAFHGPQCIFVDPNIKAAADRATALAFFGRGYSVVRYSESEILSGIAIAHLRKTLAQLGPENKVYRNWCPQEVVRSKI